MIAKNPTLTAAKFLRGADKRALPESSNGSKNHVHFRMPDNLHERIRDLAYSRKTNVNALMVALLEEALKQK